MATLKVKLAPRNGDWTNCCVPIDTLLTATHRHVTRRRLARNFTFFLLYLLLLYITLVPTEVFFMSNARLLANLMYWDRALAPQPVFQTFSPEQTRFSQAQWWGPDSAGSGVRDWRQYETWAQTRLLYYSPCVNTTTSQCVFPPLFQQSTSNAYAGCVRGSDAEDLLCMDSAVLSDNCYAGAFGARVVSPAPSARAACVPDSLGLLFACGLDANEGWTNVELELLPSSIASVFNSNPARNASLTRATRTTTVSQTYLQADAYYQSITFQTGQLLSGMFSLTPKISSITYTPETSITVVAVLLCILVAVDVLFSLRKLCKHPNSVLSPWLLLDLLLLALYALLFYSLSFIWSNDLFDDAPGNGDGAVGEDNCKVMLDANTRIHLTQFYGALLAISFIQILRFLSLLPLLHLVLSSLARTFKNAGGALLVILIVYMLNALSVMIFFGAQSMPFRYYGASFFSTIVLPEGFDVNFLGGQMQFARANDDIPSFYLSLVVFVVNRCVSSTVMAFVCIVFWMQKKQHDRDLAQQVLDEQLLTPKTKGSKDAYSISAWFWFLAYEFWGERPYENVNVETAYERLVLFCRENPYRNFITYEEIEFAIGIPPGRVGVRTRVQPEQVESFMHLCGVSNIYQNGDARRCEAKWAEQVRDEGGSRAFKRKTTHQIAVFACRTTNTVEKNRGLVLSINTCIQAANALRARQNLQLFFQRVEPLCNESLERQEALAFNTARLRLHHELACNVFPRLGIVMLSECFEERVTESKASSSSQAAGREAVVHVNFLTCKKRHTPHASRADEEIGVEIANELRALLEERNSAYALAQAKAYNLALKATKRRLLQERKLKRFAPCVRISVRGEWDRLETIPLQVNFVYFLLQGARLSLANSNGTSGPDATQPVIVFNGRLQIVSRAVFSTLLGREKNAAWDEARPLREAAKEDGYTTYAFEQDLANGAAWTRSLLPPSLREGQFINDLRGVETETEFWVEVEVDCGVCLAELDAGSPFEQRIRASLEAYAKDDLVLDNDVRHRQLILTHVQGHRVRAVQDVAFASLSFHSFPNEVEEFPKTCFKFVRSRIATATAGKKAGGGGGIVTKQEFEIWI